MLELGTDSANGAGCASTARGWPRNGGARATYSSAAFDLAEETLKQALAQTALASGQSYRRRGAVLADLAAVGAKRRDPEQVVAYGREAIRLAQASSSGYVARRLQAPVR